MLGKIALEEHYMEPELREMIHADAELYIPPAQVDRFVERITSITDVRLDLTRKYGIGYTILSRTVPGVQGIANKAEAEAEATKCNNWLYEQIKDHRNELGAFATVSMHDPKQAAEELRRAVTKLGFHGVLVNDFQYAEGQKYLYYDQPEYDAFWKVMQELDVPMYLHPNAPTPAVKDDAFWKRYGGRKYLLGPPSSFQDGVALHLSGILVNGVFDRFPKLKIIIGHLGERIPFDFDRTNRWIQTVEKPLAMSRGDNICKEDNIVTYFKKNIWFTTSGHFHTPTLKYVVDYIGADRVIFSTDYPYETIEEACGWFDGDAEAIKKAVGGEKAYYDIGRETSKKLFKLDKYHQSDA